jgi:hypothetical protein
MPQVEVTLNIPKNGILKVQKGWIVWENKETTGGFEMFLKLPVGVFDDDKYEILEIEQDNSFDSFFKLKMGICPLTISGFEIFAIADFQAKIYLISSGLTIRKGAFFHSFKQKYMNQDQFKDRNRDRNRNQDQCEKNQDRDQDQREKNRDRDKSIDQYRNIYQKICWIIFFTWIIFFVSKFI